MDYRTKPTSRKDLRRFSKYIRKLFDVPEACPFPVLEALDQLPDKFPRCNYVVVRPGDPLYKKFKNVFKGVKF